MKKRGRRGSRCIPVGGEGKGSVQETFKRSSSESLNGGQQAQWIKTYQSRWASFFNIGNKYISTCSLLIAPTTASIDLRALSRTVLSSPLIKNSRGHRRIWTWSLPPTYLLNSPSFSAMTRITSSSSSMDSVRKGMSSSLVRSGPKACAIFTILFDAVTRSWTSSCFSWS